MGTYIYVGSCRVPQNKRKYSFFANGLVDFEWVLLFEGLHLIYCTFNRGTFCCAHYREGHSPHYLWCVCHFCPRKWWTAKQASLSRPPPTKKRFCGLQDWLLCIAGPLSVHTLPALLSDQSAFWMTYSYCWAAPIGQIARLIKCGLTYGGDCN